MDQKKSFACFSDNINILTLSFLNLNDLITLTRVSSFFNRLILRNPCLFSQHAFSIFFPDNLEFYW